MTACRTRDGRRRGLGRTPCLPSRNWKSRSLVAVPSDSTRMSFLSWGDIFTLLLRDDRIMELRQVDVRGLDRQAKISMWVEPGLPGADLAARCPWHLGPFAGFQFRH